MSSEEKSHRNIIVYGATQERAFAKIRELLDDMRYGDVKKVFEFKDSFAFELFNGDRYTARHAGVKAKGYRWHYAYIDKLINLETIDEYVIYNFIMSHDEEDKVITHEDDYEWWV